MNKVLQTTKKIFQTIGQAFALVFVWLYNIIIWLLDNTIGLIFTKEFKPLTKTYKKEYIIWRRVKTAIVLIAILLFVLFFINIYNVTLGILFEFIMRKIGSLISTESTYHKILTNYSRNFSEGIGVTLYLSLVGTVIGFIFALLFSAISTIKDHPKNTRFMLFLKKLSRGLVNLFTTIIRGTPMMVQAMILYWGVKGFLNWDYLTAGLVTVTINTTAYLTEVLKGAILSLDKGQNEAGLSLGLNQAQTMLYVIYPQVIKNTMASIGNEFVINIKDTAVLSVIMVVDIFRVAEITQGKYFAAFPPFIIAAIIYLILTTTVTTILRKVETKLDIPSTTLPSAN